MVGPVTCGKRHELSLKSSASSVSICPSLLAFPHLQHCSFREWVTSEVQLAEVVPVMTPVFAESVLLVSSGPGLYSETWAALGRIN